jgi:hypothetical protein
MIAQTGAGDQGSGVRDRNAGEVASSIMLPLRTANRRKFPIGMAAKEAAVVKIAN